MKKIKPIQICALIDLLNANGWSSCDYTDATISYSKKHYILNEEREYRILIVAEGFSHIGNGPPDLTCLLSHCFLQGPTLNLRTKELNVDNVIGIWYSGNGAMKGVLAKYEKEYKKLIEKINK